MQKCFGGLTADTSRRNRESVFFGAGNPPNKKEKGETCLAINTIRTREKDGLLHFVVEISRECPICVQTAVCLFWNAP